MDALLDNLNKHSAKMVVVGQRYAGLPVAMHAEEVGLNVVGFDESTDRVTALARASASSVTRRSRLHWPPVISRHQILPTSQTSMLP
jgi:UDP-N-acetyl-D-mannosaminuronate dehydrogenase